MLRRPSLALAPRTLPWGLLGALALVYGLERIESRHLYMFVRPASWDWVLSGNAARAQTRACQVLCFGSSHSEYGLLPRVIEDRSGLPGWNLATCWGGPATCYFLFKRALDAGARPRAIVVEYHPECLAEGPRTMLSVWPHFLSVRETLDLAWQGRDASLLSKNLLAKYLHTFRNRLEIRANLMAAFEGTAIDLFSARQCNTRNRNQNRGAYVPPDNDKYDGELGSEAEVLLQRIWKPHAVHVAYIERLLALAAEHQIAVYWLLPPFSPALQEAREACGLDARYIKLVRRFLAKNPHLVVLDGRHSGYGPRAFSDAAHLGPRGSSTLSADLGDLLRDGAGQGPGGRARWLALPNYHQHDSNVFIENVAQTTQALRDRDAPTLRR